MLGTRPAWTRPMAPRMTATPAWRATTVRDPRVSSPTVKLGQRRWKSRRREATEPVSSSLRYVWCVCVCVVCVYVCMYVHTYTYVRIYLRRRATSKTRPTATAWASLRRQVPDNGRGSGMRWWEAQVGKRLYACS
jgi:hypothetical protein